MTENMRRRSRNRSITKKELNMKTSVHFFPSKTVCNKLVEIVNNSTEVLCICVFAISNSKLVKCIMDALDRGVNVRIITEHANLSLLIKSLTKYVSKKQEEDEVDQIVRKELCDGFINRFLVGHVKTDKSSFFMHHKFAICDEVSLIGSFNWTARASEGNYEDVMITTIKKIREDLLEQFEKLWLNFLSVII